MALTIRSVGVDDFAAWLPLWQGYNAFYGRAGATALADEVTATTWQRFFEPAEPMEALLAERDGQVLGLAHFLFHRTTISLTPTCYLQDLFTVERARGQGVGRALIEAVAERARSAKAARLYWLTHETNQVARALYDQVAERSGFIVYRRALQG